MVDRKAFPCCKYSVVQVRSTNNWEVSVGKQSPDNLTEVDAFLRNNPQTLSYTGPIQAGTRNFKRDKNEAGYISIGILISQWCHTIKIKRSGMACSKSRDMKPPQHIRHCLHGTSNLFTLVNQNPARTQFMVGLSECVVKSNGTSKVCSILLRSVLHWVH